MQRSVRATVGIASRKADLTKTLVLVSVGSCFLSMQYGYNIWISYSPTVLLHDFYNITSYEEMGDPESQMFLMAVTIALFPLGGIFGAIAGSYLVDRIGRRNTLVVANFVCTVSAVFMAFSNVIDAYEYTMFSRLFTGICTGIVSCAVPIYIGEISPRSLRGGIVMMPQLFLSLGVLLAQTLALHEALGTSEGWPILMGLAGVIPMSQLGLLPFLPESPGYLLIQKKKEEEAKEALKMLRQRGDVSKEIEELHQEEIAEKREKRMNALKLIGSQSMRWQVLTIVVLMFGHQFIGTNAAYFYTERTYLTTNVGEYNVHYVSIGSTAFLCCSTLLGIYLVDIVGRRVLLLIGFLVCGMILVLITVALQLQQIIPAMSYVSAVLVDSFLFGYCFGPGPIPHLIVTELFLQSSRASAFMIAGFVQWVLNFVTGATFLHIEKHLGIFSFLMFLPGCIVIFAYIFKVLPETKNRTFVDIKRLMAIRTAKKIQVKATDSSR